MVKSPIPQDWLRSALTEKIFLKRILLFIVQLMFLVEYKLDAYPTPERLPGIPRIIATETSSALATRTL